jgi:hypothetical protein
MKTQPKISWAAMNVFITIIVVAQYSRILSRPARMTEFPDSGIPAFKLQAGRKWRKKPVADQAVVETIDH